MAGTIISTGGATVEYHVTRFSQSQTYFSYFSYLLTVMGLSIVLVDCHRWVVKQQWIKQRGGGLRGLDTDASLAASTW